MHGHVFKNRPHRSENEHGKEVRKCSTTNWRSEVRLKIILNDNTIRCKSFLHLMALSFKVIFNHMERALSKRKLITIDGFSKVLEEKWESVPLEILRKSCSVMEITLQTCSPETRLSDWTYNTQYLQLKH